MATAHVSMYNASHSYVKISVWLNIDFETYESIRIVRRQNRDSYMNRFLRAPLVFSSSSLKQHNMASLPLLRVPGGGVYLGLWCNGPGK